MNKDEAFQIAQTIIAQLGGNRFKVMVSANNFSYSKEGTLSFAFKGSRKVNRCRVSLNANDLYDISFDKFGMKTGYRVISTASDIFCDQLQEVFTRHTGLYTRL